MARVDSIAAPSRIFASRIRARLAMLVSAMLCLALASCASWRQPAGFDDSAVRARAESQLVKGVELSAAVLSSDDSEAMFGVRVNESGVQPVWIEVKNDTDQVLWLLRAGTDPDLFSPLEVAWSFHVSFAGESNSRLDEHFDSMSFQNPVAPGATRSGIIFTNPHAYTRLLSVDILGQGEVFPFTLFLAVPDDHSDEATALRARLLERFDGEVENLHDDDEFRERLRQLPCCAASSDAGESGDPLNVILVGEFADIVSAFVRRGYRLDVRDFDRAQRLFGRTPDLVARKAGQGGVPANWLRVWLAPFRYQGLPVFVAQTARRQGWRSAKTDAGDELLSPRVDEVRNALVQDMAYSGGLQKIAYDRGVGARPAGGAGGGPGSERYHTDGFRAVMFFVTRPLSLADIEILDWLPLHKLREIEADGASDVGGN